MSDESTIGSNTEVHKVVPKDPNSGTRSSKSVKS